MEGNIYSSYSQTWTRKQEVSSPSLEAMGQILFPEAPQHLHFLRTEGALVPDSIGLSCPSPLPHKKNNNY